jgi:hypothetical protein
MCALILRRFFSLQRVTRSNEKAGIIEVEAKEKNERLSGRM